MAIFYVLGLQFEKCAKKRAGKRYNHQKGFQRKLQEYKTVTGDDALLTLHLNTVKKEVLRFSTSQELVKKSIASYLSMPVTSTITSTPLVNVVDAIENNGNRAEQTTNPEKDSVEAGTPSAKRKRAKVTGTKNACRKCQTIHGSKTDNDYNSVWINCSYRRCDYWVHGFCLGLVVKEDNEDEFSSLFNYYCPTHNPKKNSVPSRKSLYSKKK